MSCTVKRNEENNPIGVSLPNDSLFNNEQKKTIVNQLVDKLKQTGLSKNVYLLNSDEIDNKLLDLNQNVILTPNGFVVDSDIYLNTDTINLDTPIHEFSHIYIENLRKNNPKLYNKGVELVKNELNNKNNRDGKNNRQVFNEFSQEEYRGIQDGGRRNEETEIQLGRLPETGRDGSTEWETQAEEILTQYAKDNNIWIDLNTLGEPNAIGAESYVWFNEQNKTVTKAIGYSVNNGLRNLLDRITIHNTLFPETILSIKGFSRDKNDGSFQIIVEQPLIIGESATEEEIEDYMNQIGFGKTDSQLASDTTFVNDDYLINDLHSGNVLKSKSGKLYVIDAISYFNTPEQGYGGTRNLNPTETIPTNEIDDVVNYVRKTQPYLEGEALAEEILSELVGRRGVELLEKEKEGNSLIIEWLKEVFDYIKQILGLPKLSNEQFSQTNLKNYTESIATDLLSGKILNYEIIVQGLDGQLLNVNSNNVTTYTTEVGDISYITDNNGDLQMINVLEQEQDIKFQLPQSESKTFIKIVSNPLLDEQTALNVYMNIHSKKLKDSFGEWENIPQTKFTQKIDNNENLSPSEKQAVKQLSIGMVEPTLIYRGWDGKYRENNLRRNELIYVFDKVNYNSLESENNSIIVDESDPIIGTLKDVSARANLIESTGEPKLFYRTQEGTVYSDYGQALRETSGNDVQAGFITSKNPIKVLNQEMLEVSNEDVVIFNEQIEIKSNRAFTPVLSISTESNPNTEKGFINYGIKKNIISSEKVLMGDKFFLKGEGETETLSDFNTKMVVKEATMNLGIDSITDNKDGTFELHKQDPNQITLITPNGEQEANIDDIEVELEKGNFKKLDKKYDNIIDITYQIFKKRNNIFSRKPQEKVKLTDNKKEDLRVKLLNILNNLGISVMSLTEFNEKFKDKNGTDIGVEALADITSKIVALADGQGTLDNISEELAHFIIEGYYDQSVIDEISQQVTNTEEWATYNEMYRNKYSEKYKGEELERVVRREILGKILKNKIQDRFNVDNQSEANLSLIERLFEVFNNFISRIRNFISPQQQLDLNNVLNTIADSVVNEELTNIYDSSVLTNSGVIYYSLEDKQDIVNLEKGIRTLENRLNTLQRTKDTKTTSVKTELNVIKKQKLENEDWLALRNLVSSIDNQYRNLQKRIELLKQGGKDIFVSAEDLNELDSLVGEFLPLIEYFETVVKTKDSDGEIDKDRLLNQMSYLKDGITSLRGEKNYYIQRSADKIIERIIYKYGLDEKDRLNLEQMILKDYADIGWFQKTFGSLANASNPVLGVLGDIIAQNNFKSDQKSFKILNPFLNMVEKGGWNLNKFENLLERNEDGKITGFTLSPYNWSKFYNAEIKAKTEAYNSALGTTLTIDDYKLGEKNNKLKKKSKFSDEERIIYDTFMDNWYEENTERRYNNKFYEDRKKLYEDLGISSYTQDALRNLSISRSSILSKYKDKNGGVDYYRMQKDNPHDFQQLATISMERKALKSQIDDRTGELKEGTSLLIAKDLRKLDEYYLNNKNKFKVKDSFYNTLKQIELNDGSIEAFKWLKANGGIVFNDNFWDRIKSDKESLIDKLKRISSELESESIDVSDKVSELADELDNLLEIKREILKQYQTPNNPSEIDFSLMHHNSIDVLRDTEEQLQEKFREVNSILKSESESEVSDPTIITENTINESYYKALKDSGKSELEFILEHTTNNNKRDIIGFKKLLNYIIKDYDVNLTNQQRVFFENYFDSSDFDNSDIKNILETKITDVDTLTSEFGKTKLLPYFKRFAPQGYDSLLSELKTGNRSVVEFVNQLRDGNFENDDVRSYLDISTQFSWTEDEIGEANINPNYDENFEGGVRQPSTEYLNDSFFSRFGINKANFKSSDIQATQNQSDFDMLNTLWGLKRTSSEAYGESGFNNIYEIPWISKGTVQRALGFTSENIVQNVKNTLRDTIYNRVDELAYGEQIEGDDTSGYSTIKLIPKYFLRRLEETSDVSTELARTYSMMVKSALQYEEKNNTLSEVNILQEHLLSHKFEGGKDPKNTDTFKMFSEFVDAYFYGVFRNRKTFFTLPNGKQIDISKLAIAFDKYVRMVNIGFSIPVAATSLVTAEIFRNVENYIGEHTNYNSSKWATKEFTKLSPKYINEIGEINRTNKLYLLGEMFGIQHLEERVVSSGYNKITRLMNNLPYRFSEMADFPITSRIMLTILDDFRFVDGKLVDFNQFKRRSEFINKKNKEVVDEWDKYRDNSMYNSVDIIEGTITFKPEITNNFEQSYLDEQMLRVRRKVTEVKSNVDGNIPQTDKSAAERDFLMKFMTAHRGWFTIAIQRKFKREHFNFATGQIEEGHYISLGKLLNKSFKTFKESNYRELLKTLREEYDSLDDFEKRNLQRVFTEAGILFSLLGLGIMVAGMADDEDNKDLWALQFAAYIYFRTTNEVGSTQLPTGIYSALDTAEKPFVALNNISNIMKTKNWGNDEVQSGAYEGHSKTYKTLAKQTWLRHYYSLMDVKNVSDFYRKANAEVLITMQK